MSSGQKSLVFNTRERAISGDFNREQAFIGRSRSQLARAHYNDQRQNFYSSPGVSTPWIGGETPLVGDVYGGLMVDPQSTSLLVTAGQLGCLFPDPAATADDSPYMLIDDPGVQVAGLLVFTANGGGGVRIDIVECQPVATTLESDSRDIFNTATGLFAPASVSKVKSFQLQYRLRLGTPGAGMPALAAGWLPLAVAVTGTAAASFNGVDFYDVRPLVEDRVNPQLDTTTVLGNHRARQSEFATRQVSAVSCIGGYSFSDFGGYIAGGVIRKSTPSLSGTFGGTGVVDGDPNLLNLESAENQATGFTHTPGQFNNLYAFFPAGLPRWVRYSETPVSGFGRIPRAPRGLLLVKADTGVQACGRVVSANIPVFGACNGVVLGVLRSNAGGTAFAKTTCTDGRHYCNVAIDSNAPTLPSSSSANFQLSRIADYPSAAKRILVNTTMLMQPNSGAFDNGAISGTLSSTFVDVTGIAIFSASYAIPTASTATFKFLVDMPIPGRSTFDDPNGETSISLVMAAVGVSPQVLAGSRAQVVGWQL